MSTIASPRDPSTPLSGSRRGHAPTSAPGGGGGGPGTPTSSARASLDTPRRSATSSPVPGSHNNNNNGGGGTPPMGSAAGAAAIGAPPTGTGARRNRAALREYYNLRNNKPGGSGAESGSATPVLEVTDPLGESLSAASSFSYYSEVPAWPELDAATLDPDAFVGRALAELGMEALLRVYARVAAESRALDAEKKALVYDNYSKLIAATETIKKMRANMDPLNPMASTLDPAIAHIYSQASSIRESLLRQQRAQHGDRGLPDGADPSSALHRTRRLAAFVLATPARLRQLVADGKEAEARREWAMPRRLLLAWREKGIGGKDDVEACLAEGDAVVGGLGGDEESDEDEDEDEESSSKSSADGKK